MDSGTKRNKQRNQRKNDGTINMKYDNFVKGKIAADSRRHSRHSAFRPELNGYGMMF